MQRCANQRVDGKRYRAPVTRGARMKRGDEMKTKRWMIALTTAGLLVTASMGQVPLITAFQENGQLSWTNAANSNAVYRVEWAAQAGGPWYRGFDNIGSMDGHSSTEFTVAVPMFYRVVMATTQPPIGMVWIDAGDVELGQVGIEPPVHTNFISGFWMDATEVTKAQWDDVANWAATNGYDITAGDGSGKMHNHPVQAVTWYEAVKWCNARSQKEGLNPCYAIDPIFFNIYKTGEQNISNAWVNWSANGYRLPTEAEWEKAARGGAAKTTLSLGRRYDSAHAGELLRGHEQLHLRYQPDPGLSSELSRGRISPNEPCGQLSSQWIRSSRHGGERVGMVLGLARILCGGICV
jgi:formylglycine-generating enzyme required for sulfatase activity